MGTSFKDLQEQFQSLKDKINFTDEKEINFIRDRLYKMIDYAIKRHDWYEEQKQKLLQIGVAILGSAAAFSAFVATISKYLSDCNLLVAWAFPCSLLITGILVIFFYSSSFGKDHPYRKVVDIRSWYFKYNFNGGLEDKISRDKNKASNEVSKIVSAFDNFLTRWDEYRKDDKFIKEDLEQVFILQILQKYRAKQLEKISKTITRGIIISAVILIFALSLYYFSNNHAQSNKKSIEINFDTVTSHLSNKITININTKEIKTQNILDSLCK